MQIQKNDVVQFTEAHKLCGCLGIVKEVKKNRIMVGVPVPQQGTAYIFDDGSNIEYIGKDEDGTDTLYLRRRTWYCG